MKKEEFVALGISEELAVKCEKASLEELKTFVPKTKLEEVTAEKIQLETTVKEHSTQLETLKKSKGNAEDLQAEIAKLQEENTAKEQAHSQEIHQLKVDSAVETAILNAGGKNAKAVRALLNLAEPKLNEDGTVLGLGEQMKKLQKAEDSKFLFTDPNAKPTLKGATAGEGKDSGGGLKTKTEEMNYDELCAYLEENPDVKLD